MTGTFEPPPAPRRSARFRAVVIGCVVVPVCFAGWLGWQAMGTDKAAAPAAAGDSAPGRPPVTPSVPPASPTAAASGSASSSASSSAPAGAKGQPLAGRTVVLDPGHNPGNGDHATEINREVNVGNGHKECDTTGTETDAGYTEAAYSLDVTHRVRDLLQGLGAKVVFTQDGDRPYGPCVDERAAIGNAAHADAAISVHGDGGPASGSGFHVIMPAKVVAGKADNSAIVASSHRLGLLVRDKFHTATGEQYADYIADQALDTRSDLGGLNLSTVPKVFIECGNMRNSGDAKRMTDPNWRQQAAQGIADGLTAFLTTSG